MLTSLTIIKLKTLDRGGMMKSKLLRVLGNKHFTILALTLMLQISVSAAEPIVEWEKTFGGSSWDEAYSVQQTSDGGYIIAGSTDSYGSGFRDVYLIKTDSNGNLEWQKHLVVQIGIKLIQFSKQEMEDIL